MFADMNQSEQLVSKSQRGVTIRDPIHKDIRLDALEKAVVDTRIFQRLRYIKQNGLLHFVFPGAVHSRFAHSLGTMHIAGRVADSLFSPLRQHLPANSVASLDYLHRVFRLAALLHDVGHCAFSHSIEHVAHNGSPLLGNTRELFRRWNEDELLKEYETAHQSDELDSPVSHEQIGLILTRRIFEDESVQRVCKALEIDPKEVGQDVRALMDGGLKTSRKFQEASIALQRALSNEASETVLRPAHDIADILHILVSGTLDVDRLDYLVRDSFHCGVEYGLCQVDLLVRSLSLGVVAGEVKLLLSQKAAHALDDMLWSRYQLFIQVLNHKTNVGLNAMFEHAIGDALDDGRLAKPESFEAFIAFIDDYVIGTLFQVAAKLLDNTKPFTKLLVDRRVPLHLKEVDLQMTDPLEDRKAKEIALLASSHELPQEKILFGKAESTLIKEGALPLLVKKNRATNAPEYTRFDAVSSVLGDGKFVQHRHRVLHFYADRDG